MRTCGEVDFVGDYEEALAEDEEALAKEAAAMAKEEAELAEEEDEMEAAGIRAPQPPGWLHPSSIATTRSPRGLR